MDCDLHIHTVKSDGSMAISDVVYYGKKSGLKAIAITDHDTMCGVEEGVTLGSKIGLHVLPAVEVTVIDRKRNRPVHVLCYCPQKRELLEEFLNQTLANRKNQKLKMIELIQHQIPLLELEHIYRYAKDSQSIYESHIMQTLCDLGYTNVAIGSLMEQLIAKRGSCYVSSNYPSVEEFMDLLAKVKAVTVIAHPEQFDSFDLAKELAGEGKIHGLEYSHPRNGDKSKERILELAQEYDLILTGGSDFHGQYSKKPYPMGSFGCDVDVVDKIIEKANRLACGNR